MYTMCLGTINDLAACWLTGSADTLSRCTPRYHTVCLRVTATMPWLDNEMEGSACC